MAYSKCPHCQVVIHFSTSGRSLAEDIEGVWYEEHAVCPSCNRLVMYLSVGALADINNLEKPFKPLAPHLGAGTPPAHPKRAGPFLVWPQHATFTPAAPEVPQHLAQDYNEARTILDLSPKASAALARRCLQTLIREQEGTRERNLSVEIQKLLAKGKLPSHLAENVDAIRQVGNLAAHQEKDQNTGAVTEVEPDEAEWILDVLEGLFDFYFVRPEISRKMREALKQKHGNPTK